MQPPIIVPPADNPLAAAALDYASRGWRVVPLHPRAKNPRPRDWVNVASDDLAVVQQWWREVPTGNVGVALGSGSGIVAIDVDTQEGSTLLFDMDPDQSSQLTLAMTTGKGSRLIYAIPELLDTEPKTRVIAGADGGEALRFQGKGGQCVMPPSIHPTGKVYQWVENLSPADVDPLEMPAWLIAEMCRPETPKTPVMDLPVHDRDAPWVDFNRKAEWGGWLEHWGYSPAGKRGEVRYYTRPGKERGISVSVGHYKAADGTPALYAFSGNCPHLEAQHCYDLFGMYARLEHGGDFAAAARLLLDKGYGRRAPGGGRLEDRVALLEKRVRELEAAERSRNG